MSAGKPESVYDKGGLFDFSSPEGLFVFGAVALVVLAAIGWAIFYYRGRKRHHKHGHHHHHHHHRHEQHEGEDRHEQHAESDSSESGTDAESEGGEHVRVRRRRKHRKREHRPRNPTLAETGGLPPIRTEAPPGP